MRRLAFSFALALLLAACGAEDPRKALIGDWLAADQPQGTVTMTLAEDGSVTVRIVQAGNTIENAGRWSLAEGKLALTAKSGDSEKTIVCDYEIKDDTLRLSGSDRDCETAPLFQRAKDRA